MYEFNCQFEKYKGSHVEIFIDKSENPDFDTEIFVNADLRRYPLRDYAGMWNTMTNVVKNYDKVGKRNKKKDDLHLNKHAMHLLRLFMMALDILEKGEIHTYREEEHELLMDIRLGKFQKKDGGFDESFYDLVSEYEKIILNA